MVLPKIWTFGEELYSADLNGNFNYLDNKPLDYTPLEYVEAAFSDPNLVLDVDSGAHFSFKRTMAGKENLLAPQNMPEGSVVSFYIDSTHNGTSAPVVEGRASGVRASAGTSHTITLPTSIVEGELLLVFFSSDGAPTISVGSGTGWSKLGQTSQSTTVTGAVFWKIADGSDSLSLTTSASEESSHVSMRISGVYFPASIVFETSSGDSTNSDPASATTASTDNRGRLWIASRHGDSTVVATVAPSGYGNLQSQAASTTGGASTNTAEITTTGTASTENPGTFTSASEQWVCFTVGIDSVGSYTLTYASEYDNTPTITKKTLLQIVSAPDSRYLALPVWSE